MASYPAFRMIQGEVVPEPTGLGQEGLEGQAPLRRRRAQDQERLEARVAVPLQRHDACIRNDRRAGLRPSRRRLAKGLAGGQQGGLAPA